MKKAIKTDNAPAAVGAYSQGIMVNGILFVSGQMNLLIDARQAALPVKNS